MAERQAEDDSKSLEEKLQLHFHDRELLRQALVHRSYLNENPLFRGESNERLEFLGDAVISLVAAELLFHRFQELSEGYLTSLRASLVRGEALARLCRNLELHKYVRLGRGEAATGGRTRTRILAGLLEAIVGAIYVDQGMDEARRFVTALLEPELTRADLRQAGKDAKSRLQELVQGSSRQTPIYKTMAATGPDHAKTFTIGVFAGEQLLAVGDGRSKQEAEQEAAQNALRAIEGT